MAVINALKETTGAKTKVQKAFEQYAKLQAEVKVLEAKIKEIKSRKEYVDAKAEIVACCKCSKGKLSHMGLTATWIHKDEFVTRAQEYVQITGMPAVELPKIDDNTSKALELLISIFSKQEVEV